jgi:hypothetical protein
MEKYIEDEVLRQLPIRFGEIDLQTKQTSEDKKKSAADAANLKRKMERWKELYINGIIELGEYKKERDLLSAELSKISPQTPQTNKLREIIQSGWREMYDNLDDTGRRAFWCSVAEDITVSRSKEVALKLRFF